VKRVSVKAAMSSTNIQGSEDMEGPPKKDSSAYEEAKSYVFLEVEMHHPLIAKRPASALASRLGEMRESEVKGRGRRVRNGGWGDIWWGRGNRGHVENVREVRWRREGGREGEDQGRGRERGRIRRKERGGNDEMGSEGRNPSSH
jgi:hypothetical protein